MLLSEKWFPLFGSKLKANGAMRSLLRPSIAAAGLLTAVALAPLLATAAAAQPPVYKDAERARPAGPHAAHPPLVVIEPDPACCAGVQGYRRPVNGGPGYVGSVRGLGRPSYDGLWPPPGYGSFREHPFD
jgi:hypothetical protein